MRQVKVSATIITLNEEEKLQGCLDSLKDWVFEIVLIDSGSWDKTLEIAKRSNCKIYGRDFDHFASQKNFASSKTTGDWVLSVDADERIPQGLADEIIQAVQSDKYQGYLMPRRNFILGGEIKHSRWSPDKHVWLWKKGFGEWVGDVHEEVKVKGAVGELQNGKLHYQDKSIGEFIQTNNHYSSLLSRQMFRNGEKFSVYKTVQDLLFEFSVRYLYKLGFLDGWRGLVLAILMSYYRFQVWLKLFQLQRSNR